MPKDEFKVVAAFAGDKQIWRSDEKSILVCPSFLSELLELVDDGHVNSLSKRFLGVESETSSQEIVIDFEDRICRVMIDFDEKKLAFSRKDYLAIKGFCSDYDLKVEDWSHN